MTEAGRFILLQFKVILTSFQSNSITSQSIFFFNLICPGINFPVCFNKCMFPVILHNFAGTQY